MTIEMSPASVEAKPAAASEAKNTKGASAGAGKSNTTGQGFMAILAAVDTSAAAAPTVAEDGLQALPGDTLPAVVTAMPADWLAADARKEDVPMDAAALLAQSMQWAPVEPNRGDAGAGLQALARGLAAPQGSTTDSAPETVSKQAKGKSDIAAGQTSYGATLTNVTGASGQSPSDSRALQFTQKIETMQVQPSAVASAVASATVSVGLEGVARDRSIFKPTATEGAAPPQPVATSAPSTAILDAPGVVAPAEVYVAEQVKYWISNDVQNAEMKLDGIGNNPVEVSISMQGNEAHVAFRTDELQAREALENASLHLKDLVQREGLVLSGVSVGTAGAGAGDSGAQDRKSRQGARVATVVSAQPAPAINASSNGRVTGRALDLFV
jgi:flagellar hook-length control protein FliK